MCDTSRLMTAQQGTPHHYRMSTTPSPNHLSTRIGVNLMSKVFVATLSLLSLAGCLRSQLAQDSSGHNRLRQRRKNR
jgi:hypothetical protein